MDYAYKTTTKGRAIIAACMHLEKPVKITRVAFGRGTVPEGTELADVHELLEFVSDGTIASRDHADDRFSMTIQYANSEHPDIPTFYLSEFMIYVEDPETGEETDLIYGTLGDYRQPVPAYNVSYPPSVFNFPLTIIVSSDLDVSVSAPTGLVTYDDLADIVEASGATELKAVEALKLATEAIETIDEVNESLRGIIPGNGDDSDGNGDEESKTLAEVLSEAFDGKASADPNTGKLLASALPSDALYEITNGLPDQTSDGLSAGDYLPLLSAAADDPTLGTGKKVTLETLMSYLSANSGGAKIETGSYVGTGTYGENNPCSLTFGFSPTLLILFDSVTAMVLNRLVPGSGSESGYPAKACIANPQLLTTDYEKDALWGNVFRSNTNTRYYFYAKKSSDGRAVSWYHTYSGFYQFNEDGGTYHYLALG